MAKEKEKESKMNKKNGFSELTSEDKLKLGADLTPQGKERWVRLVCESNPEYFFAIPTKTVKMYGMPTGPDGKPMTVRQSGGRLSDAEKEKRAREKAAEIEKMAAMSAEELAEYKRAKREAAAEKRQAAKAAEREKLIAELKADIAAGRV